MSRTRRGNTDSKGRVLEEVVARLQQAGFSDVETRVKLPSRRDPSDFREIDVVVSLWGPLQQLRVPFECRNLASKVGPRQIGEFRDKLEDVGLPVPYGVFVTTTGFTSGGLRRGRELGIKTLLASGLTPDRVRVAVHDAMRSTVVLFLSVHTLQQLDYASGPGQNFEHGVPGAVFDECLELPDGSLPQIEHLFALLADLWCSGAIPRRLGMHGGVFRPPEGFRLSPKMEPLQSGVIWANLRVYGVVFPSTGTAQATGLWDAATGAAAQLGVALSFPGSTPTHSDLVFDSEEELKNHLEAQDIRFQVVTRIWVPRVQFQHFWWPVSPQALARAEALRSQGDTLSFETVEKGSLALGWVEDPRQSSGLSRPWDEYA